MKTPEEENSIADFTIFFMGLSKIPVLGHGETLVSSNPKWRNSLWRPFREDRRKTVKLPEKRILVTRVSSGLGGQSKQRVIPSRIKRPDQYVRYPAMGPTEKGGGFPGGDGLPRFAAECPEWFSRGSSRRRRRPEWRQGGAPCLVSFRWELNGMVRRNLSELRWSGMSPYGT